MSYSSEKPYPPWKCRLRSVDRVAVSAAKTKAMPARQSKSVMSASSTLQIPGADWSPDHAALWVRRRAPSMSAGRSAKPCWTAWKEPIGTPNW
jgi:hypothetical protein